MSDYGYPSAPAGNPMGQLPMQQPPPVYPKLDIGDVIQTSAGLIGKNFGSFVSVAALFAIPGLILNGVLAKMIMGAMAPLQAAMLSGDIAGMFDAFPMTGFVLSLAGSFVTDVLVYMGMGTLMYAAVESLAGRQHSIGAVLSHGLRFAPSVAVVAIVMLVAQYVVVLPGAVALGITSAAASATGLEAVICCLLPTGLLMCFVPLVFMFILLFLAVPSAVLEGVGPFAALSRSVELTKGHRGNIFLILLLVGLVMGFLIIILSQFGSSSMVLDEATMQFQEPTTFAFIVGLIGDFIVVMFRIVVISSLASVIYARIRGLKDGVDANAIAQVFS